MCSRCPCASTTRGIYTPFSSQVSLLEHHLQHPLQFIPPLARVSWFAGAGVECCWRECGFCLGTCAAKRASARSNGAGPTPFSTPAPTTTHTCDNNYLHLLQQHYTSTPQIRAPGFPFSNSSARLYASHCINAHIMRFCPFLKTGRSTPMRLGDPGDTLSVRVVLKWKDRMDVPPPADPAEKLSVELKWEGRIGRPSADRSFVTALHPFHRRYLERSPYQTFPQLVRLCHAMPMSGIIAFVVHSNLVITSSSAGNVQKTRTLPAKIAPNAGNVRKNGTLPAVRERRGTKPVGVSLHSHGGPRSRLQNRLCTRSNAPYLTSREGLAGNDGNRTSFCLISGRSPRRL